MHADAYIPDFRATGGANASGPDRRDAKAGAGDTGFDALLNEPARNEPARSREAITDPRDRGIVPGGRGGQRQRPDTPFPDPSEPPRPVDGGGQPAETGVLAPETDGGLPPEQISTIPPQTGGGTPPEQVVAGQPNTTGGGTPFSDGVLAPSTGGGLTPETVTPAPSTGGPLPAETVTPAPATGGPLPAETGGPSVTTGGGTPQQTATLDPALSGGQPPAIGGQAPRTGGGLPAEQVTLAPQASTGTPAEIANAADGKPDANAKQAGEAGKAAVQTQQPAQPAGNGPAAGTATGAGAANTNAAAQTAPGQSAGAVPAITPEQAAAAAAAAPQDTGRPRAILEKPAVNAANAASAKPGVTPAAPEGQANAQPLAQPAARPDRPVLPSQASDVARNAVERNTTPAEQPRAAEPAPLPEGDFDTELTLQRQAADVRSADAAVRANTAQGPRLPANASPALAAHIVRNFHQGQRQFEIRMDPPELGRVEVKLQVNSSDNRVHAVLSAERPETLADLQRSARDLERALADAGLDLSDNGLQFELSQGGEDAADSFDPSGDGFAVYSDAAPSGAVADPSAGAMTRLYGFALSGASGIDVRI